MEPFSMMQTTAQDSRPRTSITVFLLSVGLAAGACMLVAASQADPAAAIAPRVSVESWPRGPRDLLIRPEVESFVDRLLTQMTIEEKVGQMMQADIEAVTPDELREYKLGSIIAGGNAAPGKNVRATAAEWLALTDAYARAAASASGPHVPIPILFGIDAVHGHARIPGATVFPHNVGLGAMHDAELIARIGRVTAAEVATTGIDWTFAPTVAVVRDVRWGRAYESYSEDPAVVAAYAAAMVSGVQGKLGTPDFMAPGHTLSSVKHFMGDGGTIRGRDQFDNRTPLPEFARIHGAGYPPAIDAGVLTVMASYNSWQGVKMHANRALLTGVLKERLGFNGFVVGDWNAQEEVPGCTKVDCPAVLLAGLDMFMAPDAWKDLYRNTLRHVRSGLIPASRVDDAVRRILRVKALAGLFDRPLPAQRPDAGHFDQLGSAAHRAIAREAVRKSLVLLKNEGGLLPLSPRGRILVAGAGADNIGQQSGGWTIDWQGAHNTNADFPGATSVYSAIKSAVTAAGGTVSLSADGQFTETPSAAIVVFGEGPYAEFQGDRETLEYSPGDKQDLELIKRLRARGVPVVAVFLSGRPMWVNPELNAAQAFVAAWLPGSEGGGIADILLRTPDERVGFDFTGRLSFSWPRSARPVTFAAADQPQGALFARGYGLDYAHPAAVGRVAELADGPPDAHASEVLFAGGRITAPWSIHVNDPVGGVRLTTQRQVSAGGIVTIALVPDAAQAVWSGTGRGLVLIGGRPVDLRAAAAAGSALQVRLRVTEPTSGPVRAGIRCGAPYGAELPLPPNLAGITPKEWLHCKAPVEPTFDVTHALAAGVPGSATTLTIPLSCFERLGADLSAVDTPFFMSTAGRFAADLVDVRLVHSASPQTCPAAD
jgi:beta-glucosidase